MGKLEDYNLGDAMIFVVAVMSSCGLLLGVIFKSKCKKIRLCCGLVDCIRDTEAIAQLEKEEIELKEKQLKNRNLEPEPEMP